MARWIVFLLAAGAVAVPSAGAATFRATLTAPTHTPRAEAKWTYTVRATDLRGRPIRATVTTQIVDPFGGVHAVEFGDTHRLVTRYPFTGAFRDFIRFPADSRGFRLTVRVTVAAKGSKAVLRYWIQAR
jgi:hypothetical protein